MNSGQAFRWELLPNQEGDVWEGPIGKRWVRVHSKDKLLIIESPDPIGNREWAHSYFQTKLDYHSILQSFPSDAVMRMAMGACQGLRLLRQDPWETLASFILSSNKQIPHIRQMIKALSQNFGERLIADEDKFSFPTPEVLSQQSEDKLRELKLGYRAPYLIAASKLVVSGKINLQNLFTLDTEEAKATLTQIPGVGPKVADCVLLFGYGKYDAFPIDTWIKKVLIDHYNLKPPHSMRELQSFAERHFGENRGYAQQFLFQWGRTK